MGIRFNLQLANWLAHVLDERMPIPSLENKWDEREAIRVLVGQLRLGFYSSRRRELLFQGLLESLEMQIDSGANGHGAIVDLRSFLGGRPWTALLIPSGHDADVDRLLCSEDFLRQLVSFESEGPGLLLQMQEAPKKIFSLTDVFPAFRTALAASTEWPGVLLWTKGGDSVYLPIGREPQSATERTRWIFATLNEKFSLDLETLRADYNRRFGLNGGTKSDRVSIIQLSDIHLGSQEANLRLPHIQNTLINLVNDLSDQNGTIIPLISGDLMDSPIDEHYSRVTAFLGVVASLGTEEPIVLLGNHDVRRGGILDIKLQTAMRMSHQTDFVRWFDDSKIAIACFDSVRGGRLARGRIGEEQFLGMGQTLDRKCRRDHEYLVIAALHHHPIPVQIPNWYARAFYERVLGNAFEHTEELEDSESFVDFIEARRFAAVLHGHKHIPRIDETKGGIPVIGCGSSVGKVKTRDRGTFMSINLLSINTSTRTLSARLLAERVPGGGLTEYKSHEMVWSPQPAHTYRAAIQ